MAADLSLATLRQAKQPSIYLSKHIGSQMARILLVDDDDDVRTLLEQVLIAERYEVDAAATVETARALLERNHYHLLLADIALPDGTGMQVAQDASRRGTPTIILTAYAFRDPEDDLA